MLTKAEKENILSDFLVEPDLTPNLLKEYIGRYPELAGELADLFHEFMLDDLARAIETSTHVDEMESLVVRDSIATVHEALSGEKVINLAHELELPRDFFSGFRESRVRLGSVPANVLLNLAKAINVKIQYLIAYMQQQSQTSRAVAFKAVDKPSESSVMEYEEFIKGLALSVEESVALRRFAESDEWS